MKSNNNSEIQNEFIQNFTLRLRELRNKKQISAREMSLSLGQNVNYINMIENGKRMPSMQGFFLICEYLNTTPSEFFKSTETKMAREEISRIFSSLSLYQAESIANMIMELKS